MLNMWKILKYAEQLTFLSLESVNNIKWCNCLALDEFSVCDNVTNDTFKKDLENIVNLIIAHSRNTLDIITVCEMTNSKLDDIHDVVTKNLTVTLSITLFKTLVILSWRILWWYIASLFSRHFSSLLFVEECISEHVQ